MGRPSGECRLRRLDLPGQLAWIGSTTAVVVFTVLAVQARPNLVRTLGTPDAVVAVPEDVIAIAGALWVVSRF
jgi:uncharacterized membrane protein